MVHSKLHNHAPKLDDDRVDYADVNHNLRSDKYNTVNSEVGKYKIYIMLT